VAERGIHLVTTAPPHVLHRLGPGCWYDNPQRRRGHRPRRCPAGHGIGKRRAWASLDDRGLFVAGAVAFAAAAMVLSSTFNWPDVLREPASVVLPAFAGGGTSLVWTWFATGWTYAILAGPILLLPAVLGRRDAPALRVATYAGATSVVLPLTGFLRWVFVVPPLARSYVTGDAATRAAADAAWTAQHQYGGALLGEHLGQLLVIGWSVTVCVIIVRTRVLPRWLGISGLAASALYLLNQGDILATAVSGFPVWDLAARSAAPAGASG
jgi:hypothetical protein